MMEGATSALQGALDKMDVARAAKGGFGWKTERAVAERAAAQFVLDYGPLVMNLLRCSAAKGGRA